MKNTFKIHENPSEFKAVSVKFSEKEQEVLKSAPVKAATTAALQAWGTVKKENLAFAHQLAKVQQVMVKGNSPKSLFSKWLKSVGIPRATAYWQLRKLTGKPYGKGKSKSKSKKPTVKQLLKNREELETKLAKNGLSPDAKKEVKTSLESVKNQLLTHRERIEKKIVRFQSELKELVRGIAVFQGDASGKTAEDMMIDSLTDLGFINHRLVRGAAPIYTFKADGTVDVSVPKKPAGSVRPTQAVATA